MRAAFAPRQTCFAPGPILAFSARASQAGAYPAHEISQASSPTGDAKEAAAGPYAEPSLVVLTQFDQPA